MALTVKQLNGDTTFLLTFSPAFAPDHPAMRVKFPGDFTILLDPWLTGHSSILHPAFQVSHHTVEPAVTSIEEIKQHIDLIVISQDKPDHCHQQTLCSLPKEKHIDILATPAAAKKIKSWKYFDPTRVHILPPFKPDNPHTIVRIGLPAYTSSKAGGQVTVANLAPKRDITGLHNAIAITYQPPDTVFTLNSQWDRYTPGTTVQLSATGFTRPTSSPRRPRTKSDADDTDFKTSLSDSNKTLRKAISYPYLPVTDSPAPPLPPLPTTSPSNHHHHHHRHHTRVDSATTSTPTLPPPTPKSPPTNHEPTLRILYTPHGTAPSTLTPYLTHRPSSSSTMPTTRLPFLALLHSLNTATQPWFLGGTVAAGAPGGLELMRLTRAKYWVGAHDAVKREGGVVTRWLRGGAWGTGEVQGWLDEEEEDGRRLVLRLGVGECVRLRG